MEKKKPSRLFAVIKYIVLKAYPKMKIVGLGNLPDEPVIIVANHTQLHSPVACELYFDDNYYTWCASQMMHLKEVPQYAFSDFWSKKPKWTHPFYRLLSYLIAPLSVVVFNNARTVGVYRDMRILSTFKNTIKLLNQGKSVIVFPEHDKAYNSIVCDFQQNFVDVAKLYYKKTGKELLFVPMYVAPKLKAMYLGKPTSFCQSAKIEDERKRICKYLMQEITNIAKALPSHRVVPYRNIPKKYYPLNTDSEVKIYEKSSR